MHRTITHITKFTTISLIELKTVLIVVICVLVYFLYVHLGLLMRKRNSFPNFIRSVLFRTLVIKLLHFLLQHAHALELLSNHLTEGASALDVGSGSGYLTACMAIMVRPRLCSLYVHALCLGCRYSCRFMHW